VRWPGQRMVSSPISAKPTLRDLGHWKVYIGQKVNSSTGSVSTVVMLLFDRMIPCCNHWVTGLPTNPLSASPGMVIYSTGFHSTPLKTATALYFGKKRRVLIYDPICLANTMQST